MYKIDVRLGDDLQTFYDLLSATRRIERVGRSKLIEANRQLSQTSNFHELNSLSLIRLMKGFTFGLGLSTFTAVTFFSWKNVLGPLANRLVVQIYTNYNKQYGWIFNVTALQCS